MNQIKYIKLCIYFICLIICLVTHSKDLKNIEIVTEEYPPYNYSDKNGRVIGINTEIIQAVLKEIQISGKISVYPWKRAQKIAQNNPNILIYSIVRNPAREKYYKWVGKINKQRFNIYSKDKQIKLSSIEDAKKYIVGVYNGDILEILFLRHGFRDGDNLYIAQKNENLYKMLTSDRIQLWPIDEAAAKFLLRKNNEKIDDLGIAFKIPAKELSDTDLYMAFGTKTSDEVVNIFKKGLEKIIKNGTHKKILENQSSSTTDEKVEN
ncbi:substrate-binding periplasmic protein [Fluviispira vulneris]|uniref:substrate-binding periplasmic protein n=1 Tax=Fluviispira vulneris TaxID=2763012 RepID=UPI0016468B73|nr:ABC transporter substrate-binding protein [Fluviispira vulneris]